MMVTRFLERKIREKRVSSPDRLNKKPNLVVPNRGRHRARGWRKRRLRSMALQKSMFQRTSLQFQKRSNKKRKRKREKTKEPFRWIVSERGMPDKPLRITLKKMKCTRKRLESTGIRQSAFFTRKDGATKGTSARSFVTKWPRKSTKKETEERVHIHRHDH